MQYQHFEEISSHTINLSRIYFPLPNPWDGVSPQALPSTRTHSPTTPSPLPFPPHFLGTYYPLFGVISITMSPSHQPYHTRATSSSQAPWRSFPSDLTDVSLFDPFVYFYGPNLTCLCCLGTLPIPPGCPHLQSVHGLFLTFTD